MRTSFKIIQFIIKIIVFPLYLLFVIASIDNYDEFKQGMKEFWKMPNRKW